jgi:hypothetical protein
LLAGPEPAAQLPRVIRVACRDAASHRLFSARSGLQYPGDSQMNSIVYLVGLVVIVMFILSFIGLR